MRSNFERLKFRSHGCPYLCVAASGSARYYQYDVTGRLIFGPMAFFERGRLGPHGINVVRDLFGPSGAMVAG